MLNSTVCRYEHFLTDWYAKWCQIMGFDPAVRIEVDASYRKIWEFAFICQGLFERDMLAPGRKGIGFAVGTEPLSSLFANRGCEIVATDLPSSGHDTRWTATGQHATDADALFYANHVQAEDFKRLVGFRPVNMNHLECLPDNEFDFAWSSCAIEHVGSIDLGAAFVKNSMRILKPGGIAIHTTEFNCSSNEDTIFEGENVIFRRRDLEKLGDELRLQRCRTEVLDFDVGGHQFDMDYDEEPYFSTKSRHIKLMIGGHVATSFGIIVKKAN